MKKRKYKPHQRQMNQLRDFALPPEGTRERELFKATFNEKSRKDPKIVEHIRAKYQQTLEFLDIQLENGLGFQMDKLLRSFLVEYNDRNFKYGLELMPSSFNVIEGFMKYVPEYAHFRLLDEKDHLVPFVEFFDYVTSTNEVVNDNLSLLLEEHKIYSYNAVDRLEDIEFSCEDGTIYAIGGISLVRHGNEISLILLCGEKQDLVELNKHLPDEMQSAIVAPGKEHLKPTGEHEAISLLENDAYWQTLILTRIDLDDMTHDSRYVMKDVGDSYHVITDDASVFFDNNFIGDTTEADLRNMAERVHKYAMLFEICKAALYLPLYFDTFGDEVVEERHETKLSDRINDSIPKGNPLLKPKHRLRYRNATVLRREITPPIINTMTGTPDIRVNTTGYWKRLKPNQIGTDKHGKIIHGRTWVQQTLSWLESDDVVSASLLSNVRASTSGIVDVSRQGTIYIMRSAAHDKDIFKVGLTTRNAETRANELSRTTGSPDMFLVVESFEVSDCIIAEKLIHERLQAYRFNPKREFFKAPYGLIRKAVAEVVSSLEETGSTLED